MIIMTAETPMMIPSIVKKLRPLLARSEVIENLIDCLKKENTSLI